MKLFSSTLAAAALALSFTATAQEENRQTLVIEGSGILDTQDVYTHYPDAANYRIFVEFDTSVVGESSISEGGDFRTTYEGAVTYFEIKFYDEEDQELMGPVAKFDGDLPENVASRPDVTFSQSEEYDDVYIDEMYSTDGSIFFLDPLLYGAPGAIFTLGEGFPQFAQGPVGEVENGYTHYDTWNSEVGMVHFDVFGPVASLNYLVLDADGDGVMDDADACPVSITDETVMFDGWYDSGVTNYVDESGCTVTDHYAACEAEEEEAPVRGIRSVRSGPSSCEKAVSYDLTAAGVISYSEARALRDALYQSSR